MMSILRRASLAVVVGAGMTAACDRPIRMDSAASPAPLRESGCEAWSLTLDGGGESQTSTVQVCVDGMSLRMRTSGDVAMAEDGRAVAGMDADSRLILESRAERLHRMAITSGPGGLEYEWSVDGVLRPFDDRAREWRDLVLTVLARYREMWEVRGKEAGMRREIGSHERREASLRRRVGSRERRVASLRGGMARMASAETQEALRAWTGALERLDSRQLAEAARALAEEFDDVRLRAFDEDVRRIVGDALRLREESRNEVVVKLAATQVEMMRAESELRSARQAVEEYGLDQRVGEVRRKIERYDLAGKIRDTEAEIEEYDLDGRIREIEVRMEEWDGDRRVEEIERSIRDHSGALRRLTRATGRG